MSELTKSVVNRIKNSETVVSSGKNHGPEVGARVAAKFQDVGFGDVDAATINRVVAGCMAVLTRATENLHAREQDHASELGNDGPKRDERDEAINELASRLVNVRRLLRNFSTPSIVASLGLAKPVPRTPDRLVKYAGFAVKQLREKNVTIRQAGVTVRTVDIAVDLEMPMERLREALEELTDDARQNQLAKEARDAALEAWNLDYSACASILAHFFRLADRPALARRVRPTRRRSTGEVTIEEELDAGAANENDEELEA
ncbi:MAG: hypothetical protein H0U74_23095 [Bradymonadaceae bacterium]|nr:hypothetical protein [Lujinxingiaceae bacterium]